MADSIDERGCQNMWNSHSLRMSLQAMATRFELVICYADPARSAYVRAVAEEALREIERISHQLNCHDRGSEISLVNALAFREPVKVDARLFRLVQDCISLNRETAGGFDITVGPLMRIWRHAAESGMDPDRSTLDEARYSTGVHNLILDEEEFSIAFARPGVSIDLGGYGKGYAIERAISLLDEAGITSAILHGGTSSIATLGTAPGMNAWRVSLSDPFKPETPFLDLVGKSMSVSGVSGRTFRIGSRSVGHIMDPHTGEAVNDIAATAVTGSSASVCEAYSTALLVKGRFLRDQLLTSRPDYTCLLAGNQFDSSPSAVYRSHLT